MPHPRYFTYFGVMLALSLMSLSLLVGPRESSVFVGGVVLAAVISIAVVAAASRHLERKKHPRG